MSNRAPKQWMLTKQETVTTFESWKQNLIYVLSLEDKFSVFLVSDATWQKLTTANHNRGFTDDAEAVPEATRRTAAQKVTHLALLLGQIANYCPIISRNTIVRNSTSLDTIWQAIRLHFGFQSTGGHFIDFANIKLENDERPEDLYQRLMAFTEDNMLTTASTITHHGTNVTSDEEVTPSLENFVVLTWLRLINNELPRLVKQRYGTELRTKTLASIKPEISLALDSLLDEINSTAEARIMRTSHRDSFNKPWNKSNTYNKPSTFVKKSPLCVLCKAEGRRNINHYLSSCSYLPDSDKKYFSKSRLVTVDDEATEYFQDEYSDEVTPDIRHITLDEPASARRVQVKQSPYMNTFMDQHQLKITLDSGAETNMIRQSVAHALGVKVTKSSQMALQADGQSPLPIVGEVRVPLSRGKQIFTLEALVVKDLDVDVLGGVPFLVENDIMLRPARREIIFPDGTKCNYGLDARTGGPYKVRLMQSYILRAPPISSTIWPGEFLELDVPNDITEGEHVAIEPHVLHPKSTTPTEDWPKPIILTSVDGKIRLINDTSAPQRIMRNEHVCDIRHVFVPAEANIKTSQSCTPPTTSTQAILHSSIVKVDPDNILPSTIVNQFNLLHQEFDEVFNPQFPGYNGAKGNITGIVNMGPVLPPQRKGRLPQYSKNRLVELQEKFNELEASGVFAKPEDTKVVAEYLNPSFLVNKPNGGSRLVTAFAEVGRYSKPQPTLLPDVNSTLRKIACWNYVITTDLTSAYYQIPLAKSSQKYCGVVTPFQGVRVYQRCAMGMPGSETALEELMSRVIGDLLQTGIVAKIADDLYIGGDTPTELLENWSKVLRVLDECDLKLSAAKTIIAPQSTTILGWIWTNGCLSASTHRIAPLSNCSPPTTVKGLRSFIGAYKILSRVLPNCAQILSPLDQIVAGKASSEKIIWSDTTQTSFKHAQDYLQHHKSIVLPKPSDQLWIVTDGAVKNHGVGATLYVTRHNKLHLAGFFSAKLRQRQLTWIPCEIEALSLATAVKYFGPYIVQSTHKACVLTDSKPCVQAFEKLCRGEFSSSIRVATFLTIASQYQISIRHLAGSSNIPSDFASRNALNCDNPSCQVCSFVAHTQEAAIRNISVQDVLSGSVVLPFTTRSSWLSTQSECQHLRRVHSHLIQGTRPSKKLTNIKDVKRYLNVATLGRDGLIVVRRDIPFCQPRECIVVPRDVLPGLLTALHIKLGHPTTSQLKKVTERFFYALDLDSNIDTTSAACETCTSLKKIPHHLVEQSTSDSPPMMGFNFSADVINREKQKILVLRENTTSYTLTCFIDTEQHGLLRNALIQLCQEMRPILGPPAVIRTDPAPGFLALQEDIILRGQNLVIECGRKKNLNKNPIGEKAVQEVEEEILKEEPQGGSISSLSLSLATGRLNSRVRSNGLSAREMWTQRDQYTNEQLPITDMLLLQQKHDQHIQNHCHSETSKAPKGNIIKPENIKVGDLVYLFNDRSKSSARCKYLVVSVDGNWCNIRKFAGSQLRNMSYRVKLCECYRMYKEKPQPLSKAPDHYEDDEQLTLPSTNHQPTNDHSNGAISTFTPPTPTQPILPNLPDEITSPVDTVEPPPTPVVAEPEMQPRRSDRSKNLPSYLSDYEH